MHGIYSEAFVFAIFMCYGASYPVFDQSVLCVAIGCCSDVSLSLHSSVVCPLRFFVCCLYSPFFIADFYDGLSFVCIILRVFLFWQLVSFLWLGNKIRESNENFIILNDIFNNSSNISDRNERSFAQNRTFSIIFALWNISQLI